MLEEKQLPEEEKTGGRVVYSRIRSSEEGASQSNRQGNRAAPALSVRHSLAPTLIPLLIGFVLLIGLVVGLGILSGRRLDTVSYDVLLLEQQHADKLKLLLDLRNALTKLNNEARARADAEARGGVMLPFANRLRNARAEVTNLLPKFEHLPQAQTEKGVAFRRQIDEFIKITFDLNSYSLDGFEKFREIEEELDKIWREANNEQDEIRRKRDEWQKEAKSTIHSLTLLAVLIGSGIAAATIWEVQRRFRQLRRSIEETQRERLFSTQMLEGMVSAVAAIDGHDRIRSANGVFFDLFPAATIGASLHDNFAPPEAMKVLLAAVASHVERATYRGRSVLTRGKDGARRTYDIYSSPLKIDDERGQILTLVDVTEAAEAEAELRSKASLTAVGQAAAQVAHEIKNPLGSIRLGVAMLRDMTKDRESLSTIDLVERGIDHLNKLTMDVTQFSRQKELSLAEVDLHKLLDASLDLVIDKIQEKKIALEKHLSAEPLRGEWDADQLRQVFVNLIANAIDASQEQSPISISTERVSGDTSRSNGGTGKRRQFARVTIADQGQGMDEATRARIFEPFFTTKKRGTGLGLAIVKKIIEQHGGTISVASTPGQGTRFTVDLPLKSSDE